MTEAEAATLGLKSWNNQSCISANTAGDGACGLHAVFGAHNGQGQLEWQERDGRKLVAAGLEQVVLSEATEQYQAVQTALWYELAVPNFGEDVPSTAESKIFWKHVRRVCPTMPDQIAEQVQRAADRRPATDALQAKLNELRRRFFFEGVGTEALCNRLGFGVDDREAACYESRVAGQIVKGSGLERPTTAGEPETKWQAVHHPHPRYDALRKAVFLNQKTEAAVQVLREGHEVELCQELADTLLQRAACGSCAVEPPAYFAEQVLPAYIAAVQEAGYYFSADELVAVAQHWGRGLAVVKRNHSGRFVLSACTAQQPGPMAVVLVKGADESATAVRSHFERLALESDVAAAQQQRRCAEPGAVEGDARSLQTEGEVASANGDASFSQGELSSKAARDCREDKERSPAFGGDGDGTCEFEAAVAQLLLTFEEGRDPATFLAGLPLYSVELEAMSPAEMREQLCRLVAAYEFDALTAEGAVKLQYPLWRSTFFPLAVLMEAWSRTTGMPTVFYLDAFLAVCTGLLHKDISVDLAGWKCRSRYWAVGTAQPGSGKSPALDAIVDCLGRVLSQHSDSAPGHRWDKFHIFEAMTHCAAVDKLKLTDGYGAIVAGEGGPLLCPSWPVSSTWNQTTHLNLARFLDSAHGGAVPWETVFDRKSKREAAEGELRADACNPLERTNVTIVLLQQQSVYQQWWWQAFEKICVAPILERIFTAILKTLGPKAPLTEKTPGALWSVNAEGKEVFHQYRLGCFDVSKRTQFGETFQGGLNKGPYMVSALALCGRILEGATVAGIELLRTLIGSGWRSHWARRCGPPFRDAPGDMELSSDYQRVVEALVERGLGVAEEVGFVKLPYAELATATKHFLKEAGVPAWSFASYKEKATFPSDRSTCETEGLAKRTSDRKHRTYATLLFDGSPPEQINDTPTLLKVIRSILARTAAGDACVRFKEELCSKGRTVSGVCQLDACKGCSWKMLASVTLDTHGVQRLSIRADGSHGERQVRPGSRLWTEAERGLLAAAFPGGKKVT
ncbi:Ribosomal protein L15, partial [Durusdinium trenchii]